MKIGIVQSALSHGGAERVGVLLANGFKKQGHKVCIFTDLNEPIVYQVNNEIDIIDFAGKKTNVVWKWTKAIYRIRKEVKKQKPDVLICIMELCTLITYVACLGLNVPVIMTEHNSFERPESAPMSSSSKFFKFYVNRLYKQITVLTEADKKVIGNRLKNVTVMPNPLLLEPINNIPSKDSIVLAAGRVDAWHYKGFDVLLQAWSKILNSGFKIQDWWLNIAGAGKEESFEYLMNLLPDGEWVFIVNDNHLNTKHTKEKNTSAEKQNSQKSGVWRSEKYHIDFLGFQKDMESLYKKSEIFVLSSRYEGFGLVLIEAMSQGCAPVACDYKGRQKEIMGDPPISSLNREDFQEAGIEICENGILCEPENVETLAQALEKMIKDEEYRHHIQLNAVERSRFYDAKHTMNRWEKYLKEIIN